MGESTDESGFRVIPSERDAPDSYSRFGGSLFRAVASGSIDLNRWFYARTSQAKACATFRSAVSKPSVIPGCSNCESSRLSARRFEQVPGGTGFSLCPDEQPAVVTWLRSRICSLHPTGRSQAKACATYKSGDPRILIAHSADGLQCHGQLFNFEPDGSTL